MPGPEVPLPKQTIALGTYRAAYVDWSIADRDDQDAPLVLLLHGFLGEGRMWRSVAEPLAAAGVRCIALDLLGFGDSSKPRLKYVIDHQVEFVSAFVRALNLPPLFLVGYSYGGWAAAASAIARAIDLRGLGLVAPAGIRDDQFAGRYHHLRPLLWESPWVDRLLAASRPLAAGLGQATAWEQIHRIRQTFQEQPVARSFLLDRWRPEDAIDTVETELHRIHVPTLVIAADRDETIPLWHGELYRDRIPQARMERLPDADHSLLATHGPIVAQHLQTFFAQQAKT